MPNRIDLQPFGIAAREMPGRRCFLHKVFGLDIAAKKDPCQRPDCGCAASKDIGMYGTCLHGCRYCYATRSEEQAAENYATAPESLPVAVAWVKQTGIVCHEDHPFFRARCSVV